MMSDVLILLPSEMWGAIKLMVQQTGGHLSGVAMWGTGGSQSLRAFLNAGLSEMAYDEKVHIVTGVQDVKYTSRCPYPGLEPNHTTCGPKKRRSQRGR